MDSGHFFSNAMVYLAAAVVTVPLAKRLGLGSVLGYLIAGLLIGPFGLKLIGDHGQDVMHFAEFGVVMMLFLIGLELEPKWLWRLRKSVLGLGGLQVGLTIVLIMGIEMIAGLPWQSSLAIAMILSLSSTAIILQTLTEKGLMGTQVGRSSFAVLLFQDIAVIPILAILPLLGSGASSGQAIVIAGYALAGWQQALLVIMVIGSIGVGGRFLIRPIFHYVAETRIRDVFTATALLLVIGIALLMDTIGLSPALGTFLAGVILADSEYRHELESDIEPFKGLLLGLFFIAVGAGMDIELLLSKKLLIITLVLALMAVKFGVLLLLSKVFKLEDKTRLMFALSLSQGGEFAFVLFGTVVKYQILSTEITEILILTVAISMLLTPFVLLLYEKFSQSRVNKKLPADKIDEKDNPAIIAGFGRFGQITGRFLNANGVKTTVLDLDPKQIEILRKWGMKVYYGDASRLELLVSAGAAKAKIFILAVDDMEKSIEIAKTIRQHFPNLTIIARAHNRRHYFELLKIGVNHIFRETMDASLSLGVEAMKQLGYRTYQSMQNAKTFKLHDEQAILDLVHISGDEQAYFTEARKRADDLTNVLKTDQLNVKSAPDEGWEHHPMEDT